MNAAIEKARSRLSVFWQHFGRPAEGETGFALKIKITDGDAVEHFWCASVAGTAEKATCTIANEPDWVTNIQFGQEMAVEQQYISDWMFMRGDKIVGGETIRVLLPKLPKEEANSLKFSSD